MGPPLATSEAALLMDDCATKAKNTQQSALFELKRSTELSRWTGPPLATSAAALFIDDCATTAKNTQQSAIFELKEAPNYAGGRGRPWRLRWPRSLLTTVRQRQKHATECHLQTKRSTELCRRTGPPLATSVTALFIDDCATNVEQATAHHIAKRTTEAYAL